MAKLNPPRALEHDDDRSDFDCGVESLNHWFARHAWGNEREFASRTYVITDQDTQKIAGYFTLATGHIQREILPKSKQRNKPNPVPILLLGQLAIDASYQGQGLGSDLLQYAIELAVQTSKSIGFIGIVTHPVNDQARMFYEHWGFTEISGDPEKSLIVYMKDI